ncbi:MAG: N-acetylmuramoyl-L-alanine amidase [Vicinamibacterales bacterium]
MIARWPIRHLSLTGAVVLGALALSLLAGHLSGQTASSSLQVLTRDGRRTLAITSSGSQDMLGLDELASAFQLTVRDDGGAITVAYKGRSVVLTPDQTIASVAGRLISLPAAPVRTGNRWFVPLDFVSRALGPIYDSRLELRRTSRLLIVGDLRVPRVAVRHEAAGSSARVTFEVSPAATTAVSQQGQRLMVRFDADALDVTLPVVQTQGDVQAVRLVDATNIAIDLGPRFTSYRATTQPSDTSSRLVIDIAGAAEPSAPAPTVPAPAVTSDAQPMLPQNGGTIRTVAIDPGHGGDDVGARGAAGTLEKDVTLDAARRLKGALEARLGLRVIMTRDDDRTLPVENRSAVANNNKADLFISLHANASFRADVIGATAYVASFSNADLAVEGLAPERLPVFGGGLRNIEVVPWNLAQIPHRGRSEQFAQLVTESLGSRVPMAARPLEQAPLRVLESANMPAVLVEMGYLTNAGQEETLRGNEVPNGVALAMLDAIIRFREVLAAAPEAGR